MEIDQNEIFLNQYPNYIAGQAHPTYTEARRGCGDIPNVKTIRFVRAPELIVEEIVEPTDVGEHMETR